MANKLTKLPNNIIRGDTPLIQFPLTVGGAVVDLTGYTATFTVTASAAPALGDTPIIKIPVSGDATGVLNYQLLNGQTLNDTGALVPGTTYYWDLELKNSGSGTTLRRFTALRGTLGVDTDYNPAP